MTPDEPTGADPQLLAMIPGSGEGLLITRRNLALAEQLRRERPGVTWTVLGKEDFKDRGPRWLLSRLRARSWAVAIIEDPGVEGARRIDLYGTMLLAARARARILVLDGPARRISRGKDGFPLLGSLLAEAVAGFAALGEGYRLIRAAPPRAPKPIGALKSIAYLRTDFWFGVKAGGSVSHIGGFLGGAASLGMSTRVVTSDALAALPEAVPQTVIPPAGRPRFVEELALIAYNRRFADRAVRALRDNPPDAIVHRHGIFSLAGALVARALDRPLILEVNSSEVWVRRNWSRLHLTGLATRLERRAFAAADRITVVSAVLGKQIAELGADPGRIVVNPNGVEVDRFLPEERAADVRARLGFGDADVVLGFLGTFTRWHGVAFLAEQVAPLVRKEPRLRFLFLGDGDLRAAVEQRIAADGAADAARFPGLLAPAAIPRHLAACDVLLSPHLPFEDGTEFFGSPTKLFEYMAAGRAIVASNLGQIGEILTDGENALLHDPGDGAGLRNAVLKLASDPGLRARLGARARQTAETGYTWRENARRALGPSVAGSTTNRS